MMDFINNSFEWLTKLYESKDYLGFTLFIILVAVVVLIFKLKAIHEFFQTRKRSEVDLLKEAINSFPENSKLRQHLKAELAHSVVYDIDRKRLG